jgi:hypothetical protein
MAQQITPGSRFYSECLRRAFAGRLLRAEAVAGVLTVFALPIGSEWFGETVGTSSWIPLYFFGGALVVLILYGLATAPRGLYLEALAEIGQLRLTIEDKDRIQRALNELWMLRKEGVELRNTRITESEFAAWVKKFDEWRENVYEQAKRISENLEQWLRILDQLTQPTVSPPIHSKHAHKLKIFSEILHRLQVFLERDLRWPKIGA